MKKILVIEDHPVVRTGTEMYLNTLVPDAQIYTASHFTQAMAIISNDRMDLITLDINIPGGDNLEIIAQVRNKQPDARILVFSGYDEEIYALKSIELGADGFLSKHSSAEECKNALNAVITNGKYLSAKVQQLMLDRLFDKGRGTGHTLASLSNRELEIVNMLIDGAGLKQIGAKLNLAPSTISTYKARIFEKMEVRSLMELLKKIKSNPKGK